MNKIPVGETIVAAYRYTFTGLESILGVIWLPIIVMTIGDYFVNGKFLTVMASAMDADDVAQILPMLTGVIGYGLIKLLLVSVIGVGITREILAPLKRPLFLRFSLGGAEFRLMAALIGLFLLLFLFTLTCLMIGSALGGAAGAIPGLAASQKAFGFGMLLALLLSPALIYLFVRLSYLVTPSVVQDGGFGIERSWQLAKGNVWRIFLVAMAVIVPLALLDSILQSLVMGPDSLGNSMQIVAQKAEQARQTAEKMRLVASHLPLLMGIEFLIAPFYYGLICSAPAFVYKALTGAKAVDPQ